MIGDLELDDAPSFIFWREEDENKNAAKTSRLIKRFFPSCLENVRYF
jgi:hypothetical protein